MAKSMFQELRLGVCNSCEFKIEGLCALCGCEVENLTADPSSNCPASPHRWVALMAQSKVGGNEQPGPQQVQNPAETIPSTKPGCKTCGRN